MSTTKLEVLQQFPDAYCVKLIDGSGYLVWPSKTVGQRGFERQAIGFGKSANQAWASVKCGSEMSNPNLIIQNGSARVIIENCHVLLWRKFKKSPLWSLVSSITGHGSGYSIEICKSSGLDPHQLITSKALKEIE